MIPHILKKIRICTPLTTLDLWESECKQKIFLVRLKFNQSAVLNQFSAEWFIF